MKKERSAFISVLASVALFTLILNCANPVDDPLRWRSKVEIPVTNEAFIIGEEFDNLFPFDGKMDILKVLKTYYDKDPTVLVHDSIKGDTVVFSIPKADTSEFESHEEAFEDKIFHVTLGPIPISGASDLNSTIPIPPVSGPFSIPFTANIDSVYRITFFDTSSNIMEISLTNNSSSSIGGVSIEIAGLGTGDAGTYCCRGNQNSTD